MARLCAKAERRPIRSAMQDDGEFTGDRDSRSRHATALGDGQPPGLEARPLPAAHEQGCGRLIEGGTGEFVTTSADLALDIGLTDW